ncbi:MAG TPA: RHS repeat-associated core domain-containing protein [Leptospiraceae bacterium]|nr:RHS repeat-associated core domain-containing protein [Leptospiraceae bacterium]
MDGLVGVHIYITNQVSSNHLVTDTNGRLVCKYVYEPYGKMNMNLTDTDPDKDGVQFIALKKFTGQEYDYETGLYNYNARLYDQETGRFLQPDPVHSEHVGYDNYDRYQYVHSNPVNFTDPTGETANNGPFSDEFIVGTFLLLAYNIQNFNFVPPGHRYSGNKNKDPYSDYHNKFKRNAALLPVLALSYFLTGQSVPDAILITLTFLAATYVLSPRAGTPLDRAAVYHDRNVPGSNAEFGPGVDHAHRKADVGWLKRAWGGEGIHDWGWYSKHPGQFLIDRFIVLPVGTVLFSVDYIVRNVNMFFRWAYHQAHISGARYHVRGARYHCCKL